MTRYTACWMRRRLLILAVAMLFVAGPIAADACEVACAEGHAGHTGQSSTTHHHDSVVNEATKAPGPAMHAGPHLCGNTGAILIAPKEIRRAPSPVIISTLIATAAPPRSAPPVKPGLDRSPPSFLTLASQLRI